MYTDIGPILFATLNPFNNSVSLLHFCPKTVNSKLNAKIFVFYESNTFLGSWKTRSHTALPSPSIRSPLLTLRMLSSDDLFQFNYNTLKSLGFLFYYFLYIVLRISGQSTHHSIIRQSFFT